MKISESVITLKGFSFPNLLVLRGPSKLLLSTFKYKQTLFSVYNLMSKSPIIVWI